MYQALLTRRYLLSKIMPLLSAAAVMLCTAMVLVVWSVMGGFLTMLLAQGKSMIGDVSIAWPVQGIPRYERLIDLLEADPAIDAATPIIETMGLLGLPSTDTKPVTVLGVEPEGYHRVTGFFDRLWWRPIERPLPKDTLRRDPRLTDERMAGWLADGRSLTETGADGAPRDAIILGIQVTGYNNTREPQGYYTTEYYDMPEQDVTLSVLPLSQRGVAIDTAAVRFPVANEFRTGLYQADAEWVIVPLTRLQRMLRLDRAERIRKEPVRVARDPATGEERFEEPTTIEEEPARATTILIKAKHDVDAETLQRRASEIYGAFAQEVGASAPPPSRIPIFTWETKPGLEMFIGAVKKETALVLVLFCFISLTAVFLIFAIFWSMISEKTKDIGVLRAIGASRAGVAWLFLRYGLAIGITGATLGLALAFLVVTNINPIHEWLGTRLGIYVWDPKVYYFDTIPNHVDPLRALIVSVGGILSAAGGALIPALRAAFMDPVRALRFE